MEHSCEICNTVFSRPDHLKRHKASHDELREWKCPSCGKGFARRDALQRHAAARHDASLWSSRRRVSANTSMRRACVACAQARRMCPGGQPCVHCQSRQLMCVYVPRKRRRIDPDSSAASSEALVETPIDTATKAAPPGVTEELHQRDTLVADPIAPVPVSDASSPTFTPLPLLTDNMPIAMNWLPYDLDMNISTEGVVWTVDDSPTGHNLADTATYSFSKEQTATEGDDLVAMSSLIASMGRGAGNSQTRNGNSIQIASSNFPGTILAENGARYAHGTGARTSQAEMFTTRRSAIRRLSHSTSGLGDAFPSGHSGSDHTLGPGWMDGVLKSLSHKFDSSPKSQQFDLPQRVYDDIVCRSRDHIPTRKACGLGLSNPPIIPGKDMLEGLIRTYFSDFHPAYPFLDQPLLCLPNCGWALCMATAALGSRYIGFREVSGCGDALALLLGDIINRESTEDNFEDTLPYLQARLLNLICLCQSKKFSLVSLGFDGLTDAINACVRFDLFQELEILQSPDNSSEMSHIWLAWRCRETRRRTGMFVWILDCVMACMKECSPLLCLSSFKLLLPCSEDLWTANSWQKWQSARSRSKPFESPSITQFHAEEKARLSFRAIIAELYHNLSIASDTPEFARKVLIYSLIQRTRDITRYFDDPLKPALKTRASEDEMMQMSYLATNSEYINWRNGACDYLDVLHWDALASSARNRGLEGSIFLDLHLARMVLLAPTKEMISLAEHRTKARDTFSFHLPHNLHPMRLSTSACRTIIRCWALRDRFKARLAVVHAGATLWHVRRYGSNTFPQPFAVFLATLILWTFAISSVQDTPIVEVSGVNGIQSTSDSATSTFEGRAEATSPYQTDLQPNGAIENSSASAFASDRPAMNGAIYTIDRPVDDELVQYFVRNGAAAIRLRAEGVDNLCSVYGPNQMLLQGAAILRSLAGVWPISTDYAVVLEHLRNDASLHQQMGPDSS